MGKKQEKFEFDPEFQEVILKYTVTDRKGYKALQLYQDSYFTLLHHAAIAYALKKYFKKHKRVPEKPFLKEHVRALYTTNPEFRKFSKDDKKEVNDTIDKIYTEPVSGAEEILEKVRKFAQFVNFKEELEKIDVLDFDAYDTSINKLRAAINIGRQDETNHGIYLVEGMKDRAHRRDLYKQIFETPFKQLNNLLNGGGLTPAALVMLIGEAKRFKTGALLNIAKFYLRQKKKGVYFDYENAEEALTIRSEQGMIGASQEQVASGELDDKLLKLMRKYKRLGAELVIKRFPAYTSTVGDCQAFIDQEKQEKGITFDFAIWDYPDIMGSMSGEKDETKRISDVYLDIKNFLAFNKMECGWVPSHTKANPQAQRHRGTRYTQYDLAKCVDKIRHVDLALGLQESPEEIKANIIRLEWVEGRNGKKGKVLFWVDWEKQQIREFHKNEVREYNDSYKVYYEDEGGPSEDRPAPKRKEKKSDL